MPGNTRYARYTLRQSERAEGASEAKERKRDTDTAARPERTAERNALPKAAPEPELCSQTDPPLPSSPSLSLSLCSSRHHTVLRSASLYAAHEAISNNSARRSFASLSGTTATSRICFAPSVHHDAALRKEQGRGTIPIPRSSFRRLLCLADSMHGWRLSLRGSFASAIKALRLAHSIHPLTNQQSTPVSRPLPLATATQVPVTPAA